MEARACGTLAEASLAQVLEVLAALAGHPPRAVRRQELLLRGASRERGAPLSLRLLRCLPPPDSQEAGAGGAAAADAASSPDPDRWLVRQEGAPLRGKAAAELPAAVRPVAATVCQGAQVLAFWLALGFAMEQEVVREGHAFALHHAGQPLQVEVVSLLQTRAPGDPVSAAPLAPGWLLVDVAAPCAEGAHVPAAQAIGSFGARVLSKFTELSKAA